MKYCQQCGKPLEDSARFCPHCGAPVPGVENPHESAASPAQAPPAAQAPGKPVSTPGPATESQRAAGPGRRRGIAAQFDAIAAGQQPQGSFLTYWYGFFQLLYHKSFGLFARTHLPCCLALCLDIALLAYAATAQAGALLTLSAVLLLLIAVWFVALSIWLSRRYPQELYKQVNGDADRIPHNLLAPVLGGVALLALVVLALAIGLAAAAPAGTAADPAASASEPAATEVPAATPAPAATAPPAPTEAPAGPESESTAPDLTNAVPAEGCWLAPADQPWQGVWYTEDGFTMRLLGNSIGNIQYQSEPTGDGGYRIACSDVRDGIVSQIYELSPDQTTLTELDADGNFVNSYRRPTYSEAYSPLPQEFWGFYTHVEGDSYLSQFAGPQENFVVDAFRFGDCLYQELTDNGDGTYTFYLLLAPEGGYLTVSLGTYEGAPALALYDEGGNVTDVYQRTE